MRQSARLLDLHENPNRFSIVSRSVNDFESGTGHLTVSDVSYVLFAVDSAPRGEDELHGVAAQEDLPDDTLDPRLMPVDDDGLDRFAGFEREEGLADIRGRDRILEALWLGVLDIVAAATAIELKGTCLRTASRP